MNTITEHYLRSILKHRNNDSHKGTYGHLLLVCGCRTMPGAAVLATGAALQSGCGLVTLHSTCLAASAAVTSFPSAMISQDTGDSFSLLPDDINRFSAIGAGPGLGRNDKTLSAFEKLLTTAKHLKIPMLLDADALNIISQHRDFIKLIPQGSLMTPHLGELKRLIPEITDDNVFSLCRESGCTVVSKGYHSKIYTPHGEIFVNPTGNPGMAKGGSGDVLTGLCAGLMARGYTATEAAMLGVWIHGYAGDCLSAERTMEAYSSRDMIDHLCRGFKVLYVDPQKPAV